MRNLVIRSLVANVRIQEGEGEVFLFPFSFFPFLVVVREKGMAGPHSFCS